MKQEIEMKAATRKTTESTISAAIGQPLSREKIGLYWLTVWSGSTENTIVLDALFGEHRSVESADGSKDTYTAQVWSANGRDVRTNRAGQIELW